MLPIGIVGAGGVAARFAVPSLVQATPATVHDPALEGVFLVQAGLTEYSGGDVPAAAVLGNASLLAGLTTYTGATIHAPTLAASDALPPSVVEYSGATIHAPTLVEPGQLAAGLTAYTGATVHPPTVGTPGIADPTDIDDLELWLDASDAGTITESSGDVSQWDDLSSAGNALVQATGSEQPTVSAVNGNDSILFDGTDDNLRDISPAMTSPPGTLAVVFTPTSVAAGTGILVQTRDGGFTQVVMMQRTNDDIEGVNGNGGGAVVVRAAGVLAVGETRFAIIRAQESGSGPSDITTDEDDTDSDNFASTINSIGDVNIGDHPTGGLAYAGHIHEVVYYNRFLNAGEMEQLSDYFASKWTLS